MVLGLAIGWPEEVCLVKGLLCSSIQQDQKTSCRRGERGGEVAVRKFGGSQSKLQAGLADFAVGACENVDLQFCCWRRYLPGSD